nr:hypothetical protein [uncultured Brevundimonas sp.]
MTILRVIEAGHKRWQKSSAFPNHFNQGRHFISRTNDRTKRLAALAECNALAA